MTWAAMGESIGLIQAADGGEGDSEPAGAAAAKIAAPPRSGRRPLSVDGTSRGLDSCRPGNPSPRRPTASVANSRSLPETPSFRSVAYDVSSSRYALLASTATATVHRPRQNPRARRELEPGDQKTSSQAVRSNFNSVCNLWNLNVVSG